MSHESTAELATIKLFAMGCHIQISLHTARLNTPYSQVAIDQQVALLADDIQQQLAYWEHIFSRFDDTSELMTLNNSTGQWTDVSAELFAVLQRAIHFVPKTRGLVTPTLLKSLWAAGYKQSFAALPKHATSFIPVTATNMTISAITDAAVNRQDAPITNDAKLNHINQQAERIQMRLLNNGQQVYLPTGMALDLNGYVKGWCAMRLAEQISHFHDWHLPCLVDMGGDIAIGVPRDQIGKPIAWGVAVAKAHLMDSEPIQDQEDIAILALSSGAIATSGQDYRRWWHDGRWQHHLIHPHYSRPATSDVLTATVLADDTLTAEVYAKYCVLLGVSEAMAWLNKNNIAALLIATDNKVLVSSAMHSNLVRSDLMAI
ncbi:MAG: FAD:protein FMN transferase [Psychrobacter sp.]|nr:FAD:protein FMN transferase [Psychrobacter sp.]